MIARTDDRSPDTSTIDSVMGPWAAPSRAPTKPPAARARTSARTTAAWTRRRFFMRGPYCTAPGVSMARACVTLSGHEAAAVVRALAMDRGQPRGVRTAGGQQGHLGGFAVHGDGDPRPHRAPPLPRPPLRRHLPPPHRLPAPRVPRA